MSSCSQSTCNTILVVAATINSCAISALIDDHKAKWRNWAHYIFLYICLLALISLYRQHCQKLLIYICCACKWRYYRCYCSILCTMASAAWNLFSRQNAVHWISPLVRTSWLSPSTSGNTFGFAANFSRSQLLKLIYNVIKTGLNSPPSPAWASMGRINTILLLKVGNKLGVLSIALAFDEIDF